MAGPEMDSPSLGGRSRPSQITTCASNGSFRNNVVRNFTFEPRLVNDESACSSDIHDTIAAQSLCEDAWAERSVAAHVDASKKNNKRHSQLQSGCVGHCHEVSTGTVG